jgi:hypothetical protein
LKPVLYNAKRVRRATNVGIARLTFTTLALLICLAFLSLATASTSASALSSDSTLTGAPEAQATNAATAVLTGTTAVTGTTAITGTTTPAVSDGPAQTPGIPGALQSRVVVNPVPTGQVPLPEPSVVPGRANPPGGGTSQGGFPWLPVLVVGLGALALAGFVLLRPRRAVQVTRDERVITSARTDASDLSTVEEISTVTTTAVTAPPQAAPTTVKCPNCETVNDIKENFCHDCGQDLRPTRAALMAALAPPPDIVTDDMPYLETLDRADEQLEYVLSRPRVVMGTASSSDIVIDSSFTGWQSVSPTHAELRREEEGYLLVDKASQNGTFVNDTRTGESILAEGDTIRLGDVRFIFHIPLPEDTQ